MKDLTRVCDLDWSSIEWDKKRCEKGEISIGEGHFRCSVIIIGINFFYLHLFRLTGKLI